MNIFRFFGDMTHLCSILVRFRPDVGLPMFLRLHTTNSTDAPRLVPLCLPHRVTRHPGVVAEDQRHEIVRGRVVENPGAVPTGVRNAVPGFVLLVHLAVQHVHEVNFRRVVRVHYLVHAEAQGGEPDVRLGAGHVSGVVFNRALCVPGAAD